MSTLPPPSGPRRDPSPPPRVNIAGLIVLIAIFGPVVIAVMVTVLLLVLTLPIGIASVATSGAP